MADSAMSNSHAHITTISQRSMTERWRRSHNTMSAARLRHHTADTTTIMTVVYLPPLSSTGRKSCPAVVIHAAAMMALSTTATLARIAFVLDERIPPFL